MPYIPDSDRRCYCAKNLASFESPGHLNYAITYLLSLYLKDKNLSYQTINDIIGALEGAKMEFYRRIAVPYENSKLSMNGDVYE